MRRAMTTLVLGACLGLLSSALLLYFGNASRGQEQEKDPEKTKEADVQSLGKARVELAKKIFEMTLRDFGEVRKPAINVVELVVKPDEVYTRSIRLLNAEADLSTKKEERVTAFEEHLKRMKKFEEKIKTLREGGFVTQRDALGGEFSRVEAEYWLAVEKAK